MSDTDQVVNTDRELWREREGDYYAPSLFVTQGGGIGINVGGHVFVKPIHLWHWLAQEDSARHYATQPKAPTVELVRNVIAAARDNLMSAQSAAEVMFKLFRQGAA